MTTTLTFKQGDTWRDVATFTFAVGSLAGAKLWMTLKRSPKTQTDAQADAQIDSALLGGITILTATTAQFEFTPQQTRSLNPSKIYQFDVQVLLSTGEIYTTDSGSVQVTQEVTLATS